ncbi:MAG TPA: UdgX family uracil-DNA binding protein [Vulgatibacter sp.]
MRKRETVKLPPEETAAPLVPEAGGLDALRWAAAGCRACDLWERATQTVFGAGLAGARVMFVGEQPGDKEDLAGEPFLGPSGRLLDEAIERAGIDRGLAYVTNVMKHFKWVERGKRRLHQKPNARQIGACRPWLDAELDRVKPKVVVCLGATASRSLLGAAFRVTRSRGELLQGVGIAPWVMATVHPSAVLRIPDPETRHRERDRFFAEVARLAPLLYD